VPRRALPVYARQLSPRRAGRNACPIGRTAGTTLFEDDAIRLWTLDDAGGDRQHQDQDARHQPERDRRAWKAVELAEKSYQGVVIWSGDEPFSAGADLQAMLPGLHDGRCRRHRRGRGRAAAHACAAALRQRAGGVGRARLALGGGCEMAVHCARRVAHMESYVGLVEVGVGLVPGAGGLTYIARRAAENAATSTGKDLLPFLTEGFTAAAMAKVGTSALESRKLGYLLESDVIVPHKDELLFVAINEAKAMYQGGYRAAAQAPVPGGRPQRQGHHQGLSWSTCATAASSASTTSTSPA
jgi:3-hydroxyacyl-CoA dehydrogenase